DLGQRRKPVIPGGRDDTRPGSLRSGPRSGHRSDCEFLDPGVPRIDDIQVIVAVKGEPVRGAELPRLGAQAAHAADVASVRGELLHVVVRRGDPDLIPGVDGNGNGTLKPLGTPEMPGADLVIAPGEHEGAVRVELLHAAD